LVDFLSKNFNNLTREELKKTVLSEYMLT
jgi:hypothetical protein